MIKVKLFGIAKEIVGEGIISLELKLTNVEELLDYMKQKYPAFKDLTSLLVAINDEYASTEAVINEDDEIALIPPVSGG